jgi:hypothetical protein
MLPSHDTSARQAQDLRDNVVSKVEFSCVLIRHRSAVRLCVPAELSATLGPGPLLPAIVTINDEPVPTTLHRISGGFMMAVNKAVREQLGVTAGDTVHVTVEPDETERTIELPEDLSTALADARVRDAFDDLTPFRKDELLKSVASAKKAQTRGRRIEAVVRDLDSSQAEPRT